MTWWQQLLATLGGSVGGGAIAAWLTMRLSLYRFYRERWWQRRFDGCAAVIEALHDRKRYLDISWTELTEERSYNAAFKESASQRSSEANVVLRRYSDLGILALPEALAGVVRDHVRALEHNSEAPDWFTYLDLDRAATSEALANATPAALAGLGLQRPPRKRRLLGSWWVRK